MTERIGGNWHKPKYNPRYDCAGLATSLSVQHQLNIDQRSREKMHTAMAHERAAKQDGGFIDGKACLASEGGDKQ